MNVYLLRDYVGLYAPIILFFLTIFILRNTKSYLQFFVYGFIINNILNILLKITIKNPRPHNDDKSIDFGVINNKRMGYDKYGMPSAHSQNCSYCLFIIIMLINNLSITLLYLSITLMCLYQRYLYNNHTLLQLAIGYLLGMFVGYFVYINCNKIHNT